MLFNSIHFLIFFPIVVTIYFLLPHKRRWILLLAASYYFYMSWKPEYAILMLFSTMVDYFSAIAMEKRTDKKGRRKFLFFSLAANLGMLFIFKYFNFFSASLASFFSFLEIGIDIPAHNLLLPVGISFYVFQSLAYTIDVYRGNIPAEKHFGIFALYVSFFPQLVAGPIERAQNLLPQFHQEHPFSYTRVSSGLRQILLGFLKKVLLADNLATIVNMVYNDPYSYGGFSLVIATIFFSFQIYYDFSGYSDIAIGSARIMGYDLMTNFNNPYRAKSIQEFWSRWHISLSTWFKDYLYIPLGGNRVAVPRWCLNIMIVFVVSGLWHGASWTFIIWGALHGAYLVISKLSEKARALTTERISLVKYPKIHAAFKMLITFVLVNIGWIFFRANNIGDAFYIIKKIFWDFQFDFSLPRFQSVVFTAFVLATEIGLLLVLNSRIRNVYNNTFFRWSLYIFVIIFILFFGDFANNKFLYFQF